MFFYDASFLCLASPAVLMRILSLVDYETMNIIFLFNLSIVVAIQIII